ncbi:NAD-dependent epimerase [Paenibacillus mendelii]|uniref:NAD-dependent epimerase n=1 Tax=Paenibacillus mendelii TaxID=206163 RepID=A0ABV6JJ69_9BACL|nr:NAD-dependent epimerase [Paenibacillus mendelii]MCQ6558891.1 NAD-dependent epimerase [Paenibacillus mendelii]
MAKILVTGAAGFIGFHLANKLLNEGCDVIGLDNMNDYYDPGLKRSRLELLKEHRNFKFYLCHLENHEQVDDIFKQNDISVVVHLAAQAGVRYSITNPRAYVDSNLAGFMNILETCRHHKAEHLIYASSSSVYGANTLMPFSVTHNVDHPVSLYAATKKANELMAHTYSHLYKLPTTGLRFFTVYGPWGRPDMAYFSFTKAILNNEPIKVFNHGNMKRDFTYIDDIVEGIVKLIGKQAEPNPQWQSDNPDPSTSTAPYRIYNIGNNNPVDLGHFISTIEKKLNKTAIKEYVPMQPGDVHATYADVDDLIRDIDFKPSTSIEDGLEKFLDWYVHYYASIRNDGVQSVSLR